MMASTRGPSSSELHSLGRHNGQPGGVLPQQVQRRSRATAGRLTRAHVAQQARLLHSAGTAWHAVKYGNLELIMRLFPSQCNVYSKGPTGENVLHMALLLNTPSSPAIVKYLVKLYGKTLVNTPYQERRHEGDPPGQCEGQTALHIAIVNRDFDMVKFLIQSGAEVRCRAWGPCFQAGRHGTAHNPLYYGEYPLSFAACTGQKDVVSYLKRHGARVNQDGDMYGNTALHMAVVHDQLDMYDHLVEVCGGHAHVRNNRGATPLLLAASMGKMEAFQHILNRRRKVVWAYGPVTCYSLTLHEIDTVQDKAGAFVPSAIEAIVRKGHMAMLGDLVVCKLLQHKWSRFAAAQFLAHALLYLVLVLAQTMLVWQHCTPSRSHSRAREALEFISLLLAALLMALELLDLATWTRGVWLRRSRMRANLRYCPPLYPIPGEAHNPMPSPSPTLWSRWRRGRAMEQPIAEGRHRSSGRAAHPCVETDENAANPWWGSDAADGTGMDVELGCMPVGQRRPRAVHEATGSDGDVWFGASSGGGASSSAGGGRTSLGGAFAALSPPLAATSADWEHGSPDGLGGLPWSRSRPSANSRQAAIGGLGAVSSRFGDEPHDSLPDFVSVGLGGSSFTPPVYGGALVPSFLSGVAMNSALGALATDTATYMSQPPPPLHAALSINLNRSMQPDVLDTPGTPSSPSLRSPATLRIMLGGRGGSSDDGVTTSLAGPDPSTGLLPPPDRPSSTHGTLEIRNRLRAGGGEDYQVTGSLIRRIDSVGSGEDGSGGGEELRKPLHARRPRVWLRVLGHSLAGYYSRQARDPITLISMGHLCCTVWHFAIWKTTYGDVGGAGPSSLSVRQLDDIVLSFVILSGWASLLYFARGWQPAGRLAVMVEFAVLEVFKFAALFCLFNLGFALAFQALMRGSTASALGWGGRNVPPGVPQLKDIGASMLQLIRFMYGEADVFTYTRAPTRGMSTVATIYYVLYVVLVVVLLLHLLTAMIVAMHHAQQSQCDSLWRLRWAAYVLRAEARMPLRCQQRFRLGEQGWDPSLNANVYKLTFEVSEDPDPGEQWDKDIKVLEEAMERMRGARGGLGTAASGAGFGKK